jgi:hypothetical protein
MLHKLILLDMLNLKLHKAVRLNSISLKRPLISRTLMNRSPKPRISGQNTRLNYAKIGSWPANASLKIAAPSHMELKNWIKSQMYLRITRLSFAKDSMRSSIVHMDLVANSNIQKTSLRMLPSQQLILHNQIRRRKLISPSASQWT